MRRDASASANANASEIENANVKFVCVKCVRVRQIVLYMRDVPAFRDSRAFTAQSSRSQCHLGISHTPWQSHSGSVHQGRPAEDRRFTSDRKRSIGQDVCALSSGENTVPLHVRMFTYIQRSQVSATKIEKCR